jgi:hypothetical protein
MKLRRVFAVSVCLVSLASVTTLLSGAKNDDEANAGPLQLQLQELLKERALTAQRAREATQAAFDAETTTLDVLTLALNQANKAELALARTPAEEVAALTKHLALMRDLETRIEALFNQGTRGGEASQFYHAKRERQSAEIALIKARLKSKSE